MWIWRRVQETFSSDGETVLGCMKVMTGLPADRKDW